MIKHLWLLLLLSAAPVSAYADQWIKYDTRGHPKSMGLWITVSHPASWRSKEGERPHIVQKFVGDMPDYMIFAQLQIIEVPADGIITDHLSMADWKDIVKDIGEGSNFKITNLEMEPAYMADIVQNTERAGFKVAQRLRVLVLAYKRRSIWLWCGVGGPNGDLSKEFKRHEMDCQLFFNSFVLNSRYQ